MKIVSKGNTISTPEFRNKKMKARRRRLIIASSVLLVLIIGAVIVMRLPKLQISAVDVAGAAVTGAAPVESLTRELLSGAYLWIIPRTNTLFYPRTLIERRIPETFPRFSSASLSLQGLQGLSIRVVEREPYALYCQNGACYFIDRTGFIFDSAPSFTDGVYFAYSSDQAFESPVGKQFLPMTDFKTLSGFVEKLQKLSLDPLSLSLVGGEARLVLKSGGAILFPRDRAASLIASDLESFLGSPAIKGEANFWQRLETLDLRTDNKVFYTFRD